jgi:hypothetical protein
MPRSVLGRSLPQPVFALAAPRALAPAVLAVTATDPGSADRCAS